MLAPRSGLRVTIGQHAEAGRKPVQQDRHGARLPSGALLATKGLALAVADGVSSSEVSHEAARAAVQGFLTDYFDTSDAWRIQRSGLAVIGALNAWLHAQDRHSPHRLDRERGHVCTFSALVVRSRTAHIFHVGDSRIQRLHGQSLEPLTQDHRLHVSTQESYLSRALGMAPQVEVDHTSVPVDVGDVFMLSTDGVHDWIDGAAVAQAIAHHEGDLDAAARTIIAHAMDRGSQDNLTCMLLRVDALPDGDLDEMQQQVPPLPIPPLLEARSVFEGYTVLRTLHSSHRSHIYLARDDASAQTVVIKAPSVDLQSDPDQLDRFRLEEWIARRIQSAHVLKPVATDRPRHHTYAVMEYIEGQTLAQWMVDNPRPALEAVRDIVDQIAKGLRAFHRMEMLHQDLRPDNIMIDATGTVKIIDFGAVHVAGLAEGAHDRPHGGLLGTLQFAAPEYFVGEAGTPASDLYSLAAITYLMLTGRLPYGGKVARVRTRADLAKLQYISALDGQRAIPAWIDDVLGKALHPQAAKRHDALSEFVHALRHPPQAYLNRVGQSALEKNPLLFWKVTSVLLMLTVVAMAAALALRA